MFLKKNDGETREQYVARGLADTALALEIVDVGRRTAALHAQFTSEDDGERVAALFRKTMELDVEVFAVGKWNGYDFTLRDLEEIVAAFEALGAYHKVPLKFGHNDKQPMTDGQPALGWVDKVWIDRNQTPAKMMAHFTDVPSLVYEAMKMKRYRKVSIELDFDVEHKGKSYAAVLSGVALIGADLPAVNVLADLNAYMSKGGKHLSGAHAVFTLNSDMTEEATMMTEAEKAELEALRKKAAKADELETQNAKFKKDIETRDANDAKAKLTLARKSVDDFGEARVQAKAWTPAQRDAFKKSVGYDDDARVLLFDADTQAALHPMPKKGGKSDFTRDAGASSDAEDGEDQEANPTDELVARTRKYMAEHGEKDFEKASFAVMRADPELTKRHIEAPFAN